MQIKKISDLDQADELYNGCCFPIVQNGETKRVEFKTMREQIAESEEMAEKLDEKVDAIDGKGLSTNDFTDAQKAKLNGIAAGANVNVIEGMFVNGVRQPVVNKMLNLNTEGAFDVSMSDNPNGGVDLTVDDTTRTLAKQSDVDDLKDKLFDEIISVNVFDVSVQTDQQIKADGTIGSSSSQKLSDFILLPKGYKLVNTRTNLTVPKRTTWNFGRAALWSLEKVVNTSTIITSTNEISNNTNNDMYVRFNYQPSTSSDEYMSEIMPISSSSSGAIGLTNYYPYASETANTIKDNVIPTLHANKIYSPLFELNIGNLGDSFTASTGINYYGDVINEITGSNCINYGVGGSRFFGDSSTSGGDTILSFWHRVADMQDNLDIVTIFGGINDCLRTSYYTTKLGDINDSVIDDISSVTEAETFYQGCKTTIELLFNKYPNAKFLMILPPHVLDERYNPSLVAYNGIETIINAEKEIAKYYGIPVLNLYENCTELNNFPANVNKYRYSNGNIHPNQLGINAMAHYICNALEEVARNRF